MSEGQVDEVRGESFQRFLMVGLVIALIGAGVAVYSTAHHLEVKASGASDFACNIDDKFSCDEVARSDYAEINSIPIAILGLGYFLANLVLLVFGLRGGKTAPEHVHAYVVMVGVGVVVSVIYGTISVAQLDVLCPSCIGIYLTTLAQAVLVVIFRSHIPAGMTSKSTLSGGTTAAIVVALTVAGYNFFPKGSGGDPSSLTTVTETRPVFSSDEYDISIGKSAFAAAGEDYRKGGDDAKVVIVEFADFECPACQRIGSVMNRLYREFGDRILIVYKNYPLDKNCNKSMSNQIHKFACKAAVMGRCAGQYGKFWQFHDLVFDNQRELSFKNLRKWGEQVGLTKEQIESCWDAPDLTEKVRSDIEAGNKAGVTGTPALFINGRKYLGDRTFPTMKRHISELLAGSS